VVNLATLPQPSVAAEPPRRPGMAGLPSASIPWRFACDAPRRTTALGHARGLSVSAYVMVDSSEIATARERWSPEPRVVPSPNRPRFPYADLNMLPPVIAVSRRHPPAYRHSYPEIPSRLARRRSRLPTPSQGRTPAESRASRNLSRGGQTRPERQYLLSCLPQASEDFKPIPPAQRQRPPLRQPLSEHFSHLR